MRRSKGVVGSGERVSHIHPWGYSIFFQHPHSHVRADVTFIKLIIYGRLSERLLPSVRPQGKVISHISCAKRHTVVLTDEGEPYTWGYRIVTPRRVVLSGVRQDVGDGGLLQAPYLTSRSPLASPRPGSRDTATFHGPRLHFHKGYREVVRPAAVAVAAGFSHTTVITSSGSVLVWASEDPDRLQEVLGDLAGEI